MSEIKVNSIKGVAASTAALTINNTDGTCTANLTNRTNKNLIINGDMRIAQRGVSSTSDGYQTVDRFKVDDGGQDAALTRAQVAVTSGGAYDSGFRKCLKITNGNQTGGAGVDDYIQILTDLEAQDLANSGWNFPSASSFITLSFWIKSSVAQVFSGSLRTRDGTSYSYKFDTPSLSANTWTKVTKTIPGNSNLTFADDNGSGLQIFIYPFIGTTYTTSNSDTETWVTAGNNYANDMTSTWWTTNGATFELTGVQLEVSDHATSFQYRSFAEELALCQRYFCKSFNIDTFLSDIVSGTDKFEGAISQRSIVSTGNNILFSPYPVVMRSQPTVTLHGPTDGTKASGTIRGSGNAAITNLGFQNTNSERQLCFQFTANSAHSFISAHYLADAEL